MSTITEYATRHMENKVRSARSLAEVLRCYICEWGEEADQDVVLTVLMEIEGVLDHMHNGMYHPERLKKGLNR